MYIVLIGSTVMLATSSAAPLETADLAERLLRGDTTIPPQTSASTGPSIVRAPRVRFMNGSESTESWFVHCAGTGPDIVDEVGGEPLVAVDSHKLYYTSGRPKYVHNHLKTCLHDDIFDAVPRVFTGEAYVSADGPDAGTFVLIDEVHREPFGYNQVHRAVNHPLTGKWVSMTTAAGGRADRCLYSLLKPEAIYSLRVGAPAALAKHLGAIQVIDGVRHRSACTNARRGFTAAHVYPTVGEAVSYVLGDTTCPRVDQTAGCDGATCPSAIVLERLDAARAQLGGDASADVLQLHSTVRAEYLRFLGLPVEETAGDDGADADDSASLDGGTGASTHSMLVTEHGGW